MNEYVQSILLADRVHRLFLENVKYELQCLNLQDITNTQAMLLYNIGHGSVIVKELICRKYYLGANITYNLRKMTEAGYIKQTPSTFDKRSVYVSLSEKGLKLYDNLERTFQIYLQNMKKTDLTSFNDTIRDIELNLIEQKR